MNPVALVAALAIVSCHHAPAPPLPTTGAAPVTHTDFPNVHARLRVSQHQPDVSARTGEMEIWMRGSKFHVRDSTDRAVNEILGDLTAPRGLGRPVRSTEEMMDRHSAAREPKRPPIDLYGDVTNDEGWVYRAGEPRRPRSAKQLALAAEQILVRDRTAGLTPHGAATRVGRTATEYRGLVAVSEDGDVYHNAVTRIVAVPFLLFEHLSDSETAELSYEREVLSIEEGTVSDLDVAPP